MTTDGRTGAELTDIEIETIVASCSLDMGDPLLTERMDRETAERIRQMDEAELAELRRLVATRDKALKKARRFRR